MDKQISEEITSVHETEEQADTSSFAKHYDDNKLWDKIYSIIGKTGKKLIEAALLLFFAVKDKDTPAWARTVVFGALGYFIFPFDALPDFVPVIGYSDDMGALITALAAVAAHIKEEHKKQAKELTAKIFREKI